MSKYVLTHTIMGLANSSSPNLPVYLHVLCILEAGAPGWFDLAYTAMLWAYCMPLAPAHPSVTLCYIHVYWSPVGARVLYYRVFS